MSPENFCYWLEGYFEIAEAGGQLDQLDEDQLRVIHEHLSLVFNKVTSQNPLGKVSEGFITTSSSGTSLLGQYC
jgi:hypothetical protein